ncbi:hypothetical protein DXM27_17085 [Rhizobium rhizogenes]|uniref:Uncharacterized protein n=1 Tax=Rhizobium rhizogenes TaxID=359 RepID=A0AA88EZI8_RHIRH|nr:hypothetical protein DXM27_17085 [Rhizobium rhizogenes]
MCLKRNRIAPFLGFRWHYPVRYGTSDPAAHYSSMKKTTRKPLNRMTIFVISIFVLAAVIAAVYLVGFTPGEA